MTQLSNTIRWYLNTVAGQRYLSRLGFVQPITLVRLVLEHGEDTCPHDEAKLRHVHECRECLVDLLCKK